MDLAISKGLADSQKDWLLRIGAPQTVLSAINKGAQNFRFSHIQKAVELVGSDYNYVFGYKGKDKSTDIDRVKTALKNLLKEL